MPFDYQLLKNITGQAIVDLSVGTTQIANRSIPDADIASTAIDSAKFASGALNVTNPAFANTTPVAKGGTGLSSIGATNTVLRTNSANNALEYAAVGFSGMQVFSTNGTWNRPAGVRFIRVCVQAAGGGASGHGESGAAGGYAERYLDVSAISSVVVTVGTGGGGVIYSGPGGNGNGSSFGTFISAGGGHGANRQNQHSGGVSGAGSGGDLNIHTGSGGAHHHSFGPGGTSHYGGPAPSGHPQGGNFAHNHQGHAAPGTGGTGGYFHGIRGSDGRPGIVVVEEYK